MKTLTYQSELVYQTIQNYLNPEMSILVSGFGLSYVPFPWIVFKHFKGCFHELDGDYLKKVCQDVEGHFFIESKSTQVVNIEFGYDLIMYNGSTNSIDINVLKAYLKPGGLLFFSCDKLEGYDKSRFLELDFEIIECYEDNTSKYFLVKKGFDNQKTLFD